MDYLTPRLRSEETEPGRVHLLSAGKARGGVGGGSGVRGSWAGMPAPGLSGCGNSGTAPTLSKLCFPQLPNRNTDICFPPSRGSWEVLPAWCIQSKSSCSRWRGRTGRGTFSAEVTVLCGTPASHLRGLAVLPMPVPC